jgi:RES domain-containing protein
MLHGGRWNSIGHRVIYASETYAGALLEVLVHSNLSQPPKNHRVVQIDIPTEVKVETVSFDQIDGWDAESMAASRIFGDRWIREGRTAVLRVPSVITQGRESNLVFGTSHPEFPRIAAGAPELVRWDMRLFHSTT